MTTIERQDIWSMTVRKDKTLQISCNFEAVARWKLISDQNLLCVQPMRFGGKYFLTASGWSVRKITSSESIWGQLNSETKSFAFLENNDFHFCHFR